MVMPSQQEFIFMLLFWGQYTRFASKTLNFHPQKGDYSHIKSQITSKLFKIDKKRWIKNII